jgi:cation transport ATPase
VRIELDPAAAMDADEALALAAAAERHSLHPIAKALVEAAQTRSLIALRVRAVVETVGHGIQAEVQGHQVMMRGTEASNGENAGALRGGWTPGGHFHSGRSHQR